MRLILQRVRRAGVSVAGESVAQIGAGLLVFVGVEKGDDAATVDRAASRLAVLRVFADAEGRMNQSAGEADAEFLVVSQFTLAASLDRGRRPSFDAAAPPDVARPLVDRLADRLEEAGFRVERGRFGASMAVDLVNDGPVTFVLDV